jgi:hypothetical protein
MFHKWSTNLNTERFIIVCKYSEIAQFRNFSSNKVVSGVENLFLVVFTV